jgi:hypothetical protein
LKLSAAAVVVAACALVVGAIAAAVACIPDLTFSAPAEAGVTGPVCGDGIIELDAGEQCDPSIAGDASVAGCLGCRMDCPNGFVWEKNHHCYQRQLLPGFAFEPPTQSGGGGLGGAGGAGAGVFIATKMCAGQSHVVTFASEEEFREVVQSIDAGAFWVGLHTNPDHFNPVRSFEPGWSPNCPGCYAHTPSPYGSLPELPGVSVDSGSVDCVVATPDPDGAVPWYQYPCSGTGFLRRFDVICESEPVGRPSTPCEAGECFDLVWTYGKKRYLYRASPATWDAAKQACDRLGGRLPVLQSRDEREQLWSALAQVSGAPHQVWIGLSSVDGGLGFIGQEQPDWIWEDGTLAPARGVGAYPSQWSVREPTQAILGGTNHAYLSQQTLLGVDDTLARNDPPVPNNLSLPSNAMNLPYVCEFTTAAGDTSADQ